MGQRELTLERFSLLFQDLASLLELALADASLDGTVQHDYQVEQEVEGYEATRHVPHRLLQLNICHPRSVTEEGVKDEHQDDLIEDFHSSLGLTLERVRVLQDVNCDE